MSLFSSEPPGEQNASSAELDGLDALLNLGQGHNRPKKKAVHLDTNQVTPHAKRIYISVQPRRDAPPQTESGKGGDPGPASARAALPAPGEFSNATGPQSPVSSPNEASSSHIAGAEANPSAPDILRLFDRLLRSFRQQVFNLTGGRCEAIIRRAEQAVRFLNPDFDLSALTTETAPSVLDLFDAAIVAAPFLKRSKLRESAGILIADLYNKDYDLLEQHKLIDRVETAYYRLKK